MNFDSLSETSRKEVVKVLRAWHGLKRAAPTEGHRYVQVLLEYLGFRFPKEASTILKEHKSDCLYYEVRGTASASDDLVKLVRPIHQLGSETHGLYNVVCLRKWHGADSTRSLLRELRLETKTVLIFFLGRLTDRQRRDLAAREQRLVLDEILLVFLAREDAPLPAFLRCSLPYAALNPYTPFRAGGKVPPEIYYGRKGMVDQLKNGNICIVYGGRQLGKSALLYQVESEFHQPDQEQFALVELIKEVGDPRTGIQPASLWIRLRDRFNKENITKTEATESGNIITRIRDAINSVPQRRVLVLFDEADNFLDADARENFQEVGRLRDLMRETGLRFKVVFTGLHNVQRFNNIPNQPLAHFGDTLLVGPLEAGPARQLVREPLETLGYRFADETTVLKILSYTNYHPGLIQYFCHELVDRLQGQRFPSGPPYRVKSEDVEAVYRLPKVREVIRERLDWTLALDSRYQCIAWAMIYEQKETRDSYGRSFSVAELLEVAQECWPQGFDGTDTEGLRSLLGEMVGLGILVRNLENQYLLRSPNLVRLMGTAEDIEIHLLELSEKSPPTQSQPYSQHRSLNDQYSPLTLVQEGHLQQKRSSGVSLIFGSQALGLDLLRDALPRIMDGSVSEESTNEDIAIPPKYVQADQIHQWLEDYARNQQRREADRLSTYGWLKGTGGQMAECVYKVLEMCKDFNQRNQRRKRPQSLQVIFILDSQAVWSWLGLPADKRADLEDRTDPTYLRRWDEVGIEQRLNLADKEDSLEVCKKVLDATGGWPLLLDELFCRFDDGADLRPDTDALAQEIARPESELGSKLLQQTGLALREEPRRVFQTLAASGGVRETELDTLSELVDGDPLLTQEDCRVAVEFLHRLGCIEKRDGDYSSEPILGRVAGHL